MANRLTTIEDKALLTNPIKGLKDAEDLSLEKCLERAVARDPDFGKDFDADDSETPVFLATMFATTKKDEHPDCPLSVDQIASIHLYTQEGPFYGLINGKLRAADRKVLVPLFPLLKLLFSALNLLPRQSKPVYRGVARDLHAQYNKKEKMIWWSVTSTTGSVETLENDQFCGKSGSRTIFSVTDVPVVSISGYSAIEVEDEYIILPGTVLEVTSIADLGAQLHMIQLKHVPSPPLVDLFRSAAQKVADSASPPTAGGETAAGGSFPQVDDGPPSPPVPKPFLPTNSHPHTAVIASAPAEATSSRKTACCGAQVHHRRMYCLGCGSLECLRIRWAAYGSEDVQPEHACGGCGRPYEYNA